MRVLERDGTFLTFRLAAGPDVPPWRVRIESIGWRLERGTTLVVGAGDDPTTWTRPWTAAMFIKKIPGPIFEYACHEGNYAMFHILSGARASDKGAAAVSTTSSRK